MFSPSKKLQHNRSGGTPTSPSRRRLNSSYEARLKSPRQKSAAKNSSPSRGSLLKRERKNVFSSPSSLSISSSKQTIKFPGNASNGNNTNLGAATSVEKKGNNSNVNIMLNSPSTPQYQARMKQRLQGENYSINDNVGSVYSDRFIPSRAGSQVDRGYPLLNSQDGILSNTDTTSNGNNSTNSNNGGQQQQGQQSNANDGLREGQLTYSMLLKTELLGMSTSTSRSSLEGSGSHNLSRSQSQSSGTGGPSAGGSQGAGQASRGQSNQDKSSSGSRPMVGHVNSNLFKFKKQRVHQFQELLDKPTLSPVGNASARLLASPRKTKRKIPKVPFKVLDAPALQDDFYLNLVDWSSQNVLAVGLGSCVYLWSACTSKVTKLCDLGSDGAITSVSWTHRGGHVAVGTHNGDVQIWDVAKCKKTRSMGGHTARVGTMAWNAHLLASGSRDRMIYLRDVRSPEPHVQKLQGHKQEVCGLRWSFDDQQLASGGNDNKLLIWDSAGSSSPVMKFNDHTAAVKAIAWSPHQHGLLASGGGTADRCIRFRNTLTGAPLNCIDTGSQVCNLMWSKNVNEIVSTHGYSLNQIIVWKYPSMTKVSTLTGHTYRVLYLAMSPDGQTIVTGAGDETLRFWNVFPGPKNKDGSRLGTSLLFPAYPDIR